MADVSDLKTAVLAAGAPVELTAHIDKTSTLISGLTSLDFDSFATGDYTTLKESIEAAGNPPEALAQLDKIKSLLINS